MIIDATSKSLEERVYYELEEEILNGTLKRGEALTELSLSERLDVSRTPVRGAIHKLVDAGLVELTPNRGTVVIGVTEDDLIDIYKIRMRLEGLASATAASSMTDAEIKEISDSLDLAEFYISKNDAEHLKELDSEFHMAIYKATGNRMLYKILTNLHKTIKLYRKLSLNVSGRLEKSVEEHREILNAIARRDAEEADRLTSEHIEHALNNILVAIGKK